MSQILSEVAQSNLPWAAQRAQYAFQVNEAVKNGELTVSEAKEILADLVSTDKLDQEATDQQMRAALVFGITELAGMMA
jgi:polyhydroxyalkanoate synthesis regulator phasin